MRDQFEQLHGDEVISVEDSDKILVSHVTFTVRQFFKAVGRQLGISEENKKKWFEYGVDCEILSPGKIWRKGKVKICLEFYPDEPKISDMPESDEPENGQLNSPLDDICQIQTRDGQ